MSNLDSPKPRPVLATTQVDAKKRIAAQIEKAKSVPNASVNENDEARVWYEFTAELLRQLFTTDEITDEFTGRSSIGLGSDDISIGHYLKRLRSIYERIDLYPEANAGHLQHQNKFLENRFGKLLELAEQIEKFQFCGPSDDPDEQDAVVYAFSHLTKRFVGYAKRVQNHDFQNSLKRIDTNIDGIRDAYDLHAELQVIIDEFRELPRQSIEWSSSDTEFIDSTVIESLSRVKSKKYDLTKVIEFCREINGSFNSGYYIATSLLIRALINHVPPIFGHERFEQVVSQSTRSRKEIFKPLDEIARDVADLHTHDTIRHKENLPTKRQLEPFKPSIEFLLQEIITEIQKVESTE